MLTLAVTSLVAVYLLGPDLISRWILGWVVPRKNLVRSRGEEVTRAVLWAAFPLTLAVLWAWLSGVLGREGQFHDLRIVFSGLYDERYFEAHQNEFFLSLARASWMNVSLLWRLYSMVALMSLALDLTILRYNPLHHWLKWRWAKTVLATLVLPRASEWHVMLSDMLLPSPEQRLSADVLTRSGTLYQGWVQDKMLNAGGSLESLTLAEPRRFLHDDFEKAKAQNPKTVADAFWKEIPGNLFVILASDIVNLNLRYVVEEDRLTKPQSAEQKLTLQQVLEQVEEPE